jgi:non-structural maintenance of chromosomes element 1
MHYLHGGKQFGRVNNPECYIHIILFSLKTLTRGIACYTANCQTRMHYHCFKRFRRQNSTCPACKHDWPQEADAKPLVPVGEDAVKDGQDEGRRRMLRKDTPEASDEEEEGDASQPVQPTQTQTQKKKKKAGRPSASDMDVDNGGEDYAPRRRSGRR